MTTIDRQVIASEDDAHEADDGTGFSYTAVTLKVEDDTDASDRWNGGMRFTNITIPPGSTIDVAYISVVFPVTQRDSPQLDLYFNDVDDAVDFGAGGDQDVTSRVKTSGVSWTGSNLGFGSFIDSPSLVTPLQTVIDRGGWASGNAVVVLAEGKNQAKTESGCRFTPYDNVPADACKLHIEYTTAGGSTIGFITAGVETLSKPVYELWLTDDFGKRIAQLQTFLSLEASRVVNQIGFFNMTMPFSFDINLIQPDRMVQLWRAPRGGRLALWRVYFIRKWEFSTIGSDQLVSFGGPDINDLLRRRNVIAFTNSAQAGKTDFADDMMKEIVTESIADGVAPTPDAGTRVWADLSIASDLGLGPTITKSFSLKKLLTTSGQGVLPNLAKAAKEANTEVFFDIVPNVITGSSASFQFQTFTRQPGQDHTSRVVFAAIRNNMANPRLEYDYTEEENYIYAAGQGEEADRDIVQVSDSDRYSISQWARIEGVADARNQTGDGVREAGRDKLNAGRPKRRFSAIPLDVKGTRFGRDWDIGDKVTTRYLDIEFETIIRAVAISVDGNGEETIRARLDFED